MPNDSLWSISVDVDEIEYNIDFMRRNWWEGPEAQLSLKTSIVTTKTDQRRDGLQPETGLDRSEQHRSHSRKRAGVITSMTAATP